MLALREWAFCQPRFFFLSDSTLSPGFSHGGGDDDRGSGGGHSRDSLSPYEQQLMHLRKQLDIECKVKQGADNMIAEYSSSHGKDKKLLMEAQQMSADSKVKMEYLRMKLKKMQAAHEEGQHGDSDGGERGGSGGGAGGGGGEDRLQKRGSTEEETLEGRIEELRHHLRIESACLEGARNAIKLLQSAKAPDKKALHEVRSLFRYLKDAVV